MLELTGITLPAYQPAPAPPVPILASTAAPRTAHWESLSRLPQPLNQDGAPEIPEAGASRAEVAAYLTHLIATEWGLGEGPWGWPESKQRKFAALVPKWTPVFLQAMVFAGEWRGGVLERALMQGLPDEHRAELFARIPESPVLARIAMHRGWLAGATPYLVALFRKTGGIPKLLDPFITQFRDPAFHPWLRAKFRTTTVPMIRFWQSVPELAKDLPALLAGCVSSPPVVMPVNGRIVKSTACSPPAMPRRSTSRCAASWAAIPPEFSGPGISSSAGCVPQTTSVCPMTCPPMKMARL